MSARRQHPPTIRPFYLYRRHDVSGVSGTGIVAIGVVLPSGRAVLEWRSRWPTITVFRSIDEIVRIHGHHGHTTVVFGTPDAVPPPPLDDVGDHSVFPGTIPSGPAQGNGWRRLWAEGRALWVVGAARMLGRLRHGLAELRRRCGSLFTPIAFLWHPFALLIRVRDQRRLPDALSLDTARSRRRPRARHTHP